MRISTPALVLLCCGLTACAGDSGSDSEDDSRVREIRPRQTVSGSIDRVGEVDWFHLRAVDANRVLQVRCAANSQRPDEELSVAVYREAGDGERVRLHGIHAVPDSQLPADLALNVYLERPADLWIAVRDLLDDETSTGPYHLSVDFAALEEEDASFATAQPVAVAAPGGVQPVDGLIDAIGDLDCYRFEVTAAGVYRLGVDFFPFAAGTGVALVVELYDPAGVLLQRVGGDQRQVYSMQPHLLPGTYHVLVQDAGRDDFDLASPYQLGIAQVAAGEVGSDDGPWAAADLIAGHQDGDLVAAGAVEYQGDEDWYLLPAVALGNGVPVVGLEFAAGAGTAVLEVSLLDAAGVASLVHEVRAGSGPYRTQVLAGADDYYVRIRSAPGRPFSVAEYQLAVRRFAVADLAEAEPGNDSVATAQALTPGAWSEGWIAYRGDEDWYSLTTDSDRAKVLEVFLESDGPGAVDFAVSLMRDGVLRRVHDARGEDGATRLATSVLVDAAQPAGPVTYLLRVTDYQGDEGDGDVGYRLRCNVRDVPSELPLEGRPAGPVLYHDEVAERALSAATAVRLEQTSLEQKVFRVDEDSLDFAGPETTIEVLAPDQASVTFPWVGGFIDYQGDQDWFALDLGALDLDGSGPAGQWYYELELELQVPAPGSGVEYVWKLFRDRNQNAVLVDRAEDSDGFFASDGDGDLDEAPLTRSVPPPDGPPFWVGDAWAGRFYLSLSDFDFIAAPAPDDDWGYGGAPCYWRLRLRYHAGASHPPGL